MKQVLSFAFYAFRPLKSVPSKISLLQFYVRQMRWAGNEVGEKRVFIIMGGKRVRREKSVYYHGRQKCWAGKESIIVGGKRVFIIMGGKRVFITMGGKTVGR